MFCDSCVQYSAVSATAQADVTIIPLPPADKQPLTNS